MAFKKNLVKFLVAASLSIVNLASCGGTKFYDGPKRNVERPLCHPGTELIVTNIKSFSDPVKGADVGVNGAWNICFTDKKCREKYSNFYEFEREFRKSNRSQDYQSNLGMDYYCQPR